MTLKETIDAIRAALPPDAENSIAELAGRKFDDNRQQLYNELSDEKLKPLAKLVDQLMLLVFLARGVSSVFEAAFVVMFVLGVQHGTELTAPPKGRVQ